MASVVVHGAAIGGTWVGFEVAHRLHRAHSVILPPGSPTRLLGVSVIARRPKRAQKTQAPAHSSPAVPTEVDENPTIEAAPRAVEAQSVGGGGRDMSALETYAYQVRTRIGEKLRYPNSLQRRGVEGRATVRLTLDRSGRVQGRELVSPSGSTDLDELAIEAIDAAQPFSDPSAELLRANFLVLDLPIEFKLQAHDGF